MKNTISSKDKKLIIFLGYFLVIVGIGYWGIYPQIKEIKALNKAVSAAKDEVDVVTNKSIFYELIEKRQEYLYMDLEGEKNAFLAYMNHEELDAFFTQKAKELNLLVYDLAIYDSTNEFVQAPYQYSVYKDMNDVNIDQTLGIYKSTVSLKLGGDVKKLDDFVRTYSYNERTVVNSYSYEKGRSVTSEPEGEDILNINITVYMLGEPVMPSEVTISGE